MIKKIVTKEKVIKRYEENLEESKQLIIIKFMIIKCKLKNKRSKLWTL